MKTPALGGYERLKAPRTRRVLPKLYAGHGWGNVAQDIKEIWALAEWKEAAASWATI